MAVTVMAFTTVNPDNPEALSAYLATTSPLLEAAGAKILSSRAVTEAIVGEAPGRMVTMVEYPDRAAVDAVFGHAEYSLLKDIRAQAFLDYQVFILEGEQTQWGAPDY